MGLSRGASKLIICPHVVVCRPQDAVVPDKAANGRMMSG